MADPKRLAVMKTLVVGLGSTGTEICDMVADRVAWEYGSLAAAPWIRFLALETDGGQRLAALPRQDFLQMSISATEYGQVLQFAAGYDEAIGLSLWADEDTLRAIPKGAVEVGVGNIRMIGRLALLFGRNYGRIHAALNARLSDLRGLTSAAAAEALGERPDGQSRRIEFGGGTQLRVIVVGGLCGGTCSGMAGDFGYILKSLLRPDEKNIAMFSLPNSNLTHQHRPSAERWKKNAYTALTELNYYNLMKESRKLPIRVGGQDIITQDDRPYGALYISMPRDTSGSAVDAVHRGMAERVFLNMAAPETDAFAKLVDAPVEDRAGHAHVFCTFGLTVLEFPKIRVMDACSKMLLARALRSWRTGTDDAKSIKQILAQLGFAHAVLRQKLQRSAEGQDLAVLIQDQQKKVIGPYQDEVRSQIGAIRSAFGATAGVATAGGLPAGCLVAWEEDHVVPIADELAQALKKRVRESLLVSGGLALTDDLVRGAEEAVAALKGFRPVNITSAAQATDEAIAALGVRRGGIFGDRTQPQRLQAVQAALSAEVEARLDQLWRTHAPGIAERIAVALDDLKQRQMSLKTRIVQLNDRLDREVRDLKTTSPSVNGRSLFDSDEFDGTVATRYRQRIDKERRANETEAAAEVRLADGVLAKWKTLLPQLARGCEPDWLMEPIDTAADLIPAIDYKLLLEAARAPFAVLGSESVVSLVEHESRLASWVEEARHAISASPHVDNALAQRGGRSPLHNRTLVLAANGPGRAELTQALRDAGLQDPVLDSPDSSRIVFLEEHYQFPLYGCPSIVGASGSLAQAVCNDFRVFYSRKDIHWSGLSEAEHDHLRRAEELVVVGLLLGVIKPRGGKLCYPITPMALGDPVEVQLSYSVEGASRDLNPMQAWGDGGGTGWESKLAALSDLVAVAERKLGTAEEFVSEIRRRYETGTALEVPEMRDCAGLVFQRYCARDDARFRAYLLVYRPSEERVSRMRKRAGDPRPGWIGGVYGEDGLYCLVQECCSWIGRDEREAASNGWRCYAAGHDNLK